MKKIDEIIGKAFKEGIAANCGNSSVEITDRFVNVFLHGNKIATRNLMTGKVSYSTCGFDTPVTARRLRACGYSCRIKNGKIVTA